MWPTAGRGLGAGAASVYRRPVAGRAANFSTSSAGLRLKESSTETAEDYEKHKQDSIRKQKSGSGHWKHELASDSEEAIHADRRGPPGKEDVESLQERTKMTAEETAKAGTSTKHGL